MNGLEVKILKQYGRLEECNTGLAGNHKLKGMNIDVLFFRYDDCASVCTMGIKMMGGLMKMSSLVVTPYGKDMPLLSMDAIHALGRHTMYVELFDTQLSPMDLGKMDAVKATFAGLKDANLKPHWYDSLHLSPSCFKTSWGKRSRKAQMAGEMLRGYLELMKDATTCNPDEKTAKNREYVDGLLSNGGPAVNTLRAKMGDAKGTALIEAMFFAGAKQ